MDECSENIEISTEMKALAISNNEVINSSETVSSPLCQEDTQNHVLEENGDIYPCDNENIKNDVNIDCSVFESEECSLHTSNIDISDDTANIVTENEIDNEVTATDIIENNNEEINSIIKIPVTEEDNIDCNAEMCKNNNIEDNICNQNVPKSENHEDSINDEKELNVNVIVTEISKEQNPTPSITISVASSENSIQSLSLVDNNDIAKEEVNVSIEISSENEIPNIDEVPNIEETSNLQEENSIEITPLEEISHDSTDKGKCEIDIKETTIITSESKIVDNVDLEMSKDTFSDEAIKSFSEESNKTWTVPIKKMGSVPTTPITPNAKEPIMQSPSKAKSKSVEDIDESALTHDTNSKKKTSSFFEIDVLEDNITSMFNGICTSSKTMSSSVMDSLIEVRTMLVKSASKIGIVEDPNKIDSSPNDDIDSIENEIEETCEVIKTESVQSFKFSRIPPSYDVMLESSRDIDIYGFEQKEDLDKEKYEIFLSEYLSILAHRSKQWQGLVNKKGTIRKSRKLKRFIRKGIPDEHRSMVWMYTSGAEYEMNKNPQLYQKLLDEPLDFHITESIAKDVPRTFPDNIYFKDTPDPRAKRKCLTNVLYAVAHKHPDIGYCQGLNFIAGILLIIVKDEHKVFWLMDRMVSMFTEYYTIDMIGLKTDQEVLGKLIELKIPAVHDHLKSENITWMLISAKWFLCIYADVLPIETVLRIWDCLFSEGDKIIFRVALTMIMLYKDQILECESFPEIVTYCKKIPEDAAMLNCHDFIKKMFTEPGKFPRSLINTLRKKLRQQIEDEER